MQRSTLIPMGPLDTNFANPTDVLQFLKAQLSDGRTCALIVVTDTEGGGIRAPGAILGVSETGQCVGYVSNGCVDADVFAQAREAMIDGQAKLVRYGEGSPYLDIRLPCGGAVNLMIIPNPLQGLITKLTDSLMARQPVSFAVSLKNGLEIVPEQMSETGWRSETFHVHCKPKLRIRIAGRGVEPIALMRAAHALDFDVVLQSPNLDQLDVARHLGYYAQHLKDMTELPKSMDDPSTAVVVMFHDHNWETQLLIEALEGSAFYIGALGGRRTHALRCKALIDAGVNKDELPRIYGPIGLVPSVRNASYLAVSVLAEIINSYKGG